MRVLSLISRRRRIFLPLFIAVAALIGNRAFLRPWPLPAMLPMNDVTSILAGYHETPHLFPDGLRWWHGPWIRLGVYAFRPLSAYLYWGECWAGLRWGFLVTAWLGYALLVLNCLLGTVLAWRLTRSWPLTLLAALLLPLGRLFDLGQPDYWLAWFPVHHDLMMSALLLAALLFFDDWFAGCGRRRLVWSWAFFLLGCLSKEYVYIFPLFAAATAAFRHQAEGSPGRLAGLKQAGVMLLAVSVFWVYRASVIAHPRGPTAGIWTQTCGFLTEMYNTVGRYAIAREFWMPGLAALLLLLVGLAARLAQGRYARTRWGRWAARPYVGLPGAILIVWVFLNWTDGSAPEALWFLLDGELAWPHTRDLISCIIMLYGIFLLWKYRRQEETAVTWWFLALSYAPVYGYFGWHYLMPAWFMRVSYDLLIVKLAWIDWGLPAAVRQATEDSDARISLTENRAPQITSSDAP